MNTAGEQPPLLLVGPPFGGLVTQLSAGLHRGNVAGVVLVGSNHPDGVDVFQSHLTAAQLIEDRAGMQDNLASVDLLASFEQAQTAAVLREFRSMTGGLPVPRRPASGLRELDQSMKIDLHRSLSSTRRLLMRWPPRD